MSARITHAPKTFFAALLCITALAGCHRHEHHEEAPAPAPKPLSLMAALGQKMFFDTSLSSSGKQSCASCHSPDHAFAPGNALAVQLGGADLSVQGARAVPKLTYLLETPNFSIGPDDDGKDDPRLPVGGPHGQAPAASPARTQTLARVQPLSAKAAGNATSALVPRGGLFWDGRADTLQGQALGPLLNPLEMDNKTADVLLGKLRQVAYQDDFKRLFGPNIMNDSQLLLSEALFAIARYEIEEPGFHAYTSKYDAYLRGQASLSEAEQRGLKLFEDPKKGNCAACHTSKKASDGSLPLFTDYQFEALGVPRNPEIKANADAHYDDLGLCGPARTDAYAKQDANCGLFKTPSLRNVATRHAFFHNGVFHSLDEVMHFYVERDLHPEKFYPKQADGSIAKFNDLPVRYQGNVDVIDAPFDRKPGQAPALNEAEIHDVIAFLNTLTDGYKAH